MLLVESDQNAWPRSDPALGSFGFCWFDPRVSKLDSSTNMEVQRCPYQKPKLCTSHVDGRVLFSCVSVLQRQRLNMFKRNTNPKTSAPTAKKQTTKSKTSHNDGLPFPPCARAWNAPGTRRESRGPPGSFTWTARRRPPQIVGSSRTTSASRLVEVVCALSWEWQPKENPAMCVLLSWRPLFRLIQGEEEAESDTTHLCRYWKRQKAKGTPPHLGS